MMVCITNDCGGWQDCQFPDHVCRCWGWDEGDNPQAVAACEGTGKKPAACDGSLHNYYPPDCINTGVQVPIPNANPPKTTTAWCCDTVLQF